MALGGIFGGWTTPPFLPQPGSAPPMIPGMGEPSPTPDPKWLQGLNSPLGQIGLSLLANSRRPDGRATPIGQAAGNAVLGYQQQQRDLASEELRKKYMEAQIAKMQAPEQQPMRSPVIVLGPDGKPRYEDPTKAIGQQPYERPAGESATAGDIQLAKVLAKDPNDPEQVREALKGLLDQRYRPPAAEPLMAVQGPNGPVLVPRSQAIGATPAASREAPSETELTAKNYFDRMNAAEGKLGNYTPSMKDYIAAGSMMEGGGIKGPLANAMISPEGQQYYQAAADWVRAKLRKESGAVISPAEMAQEIKTYFPMPGDGPGVVAQKKQARDQATRGMKDMGGRASNKTSASPANPQDPLGIR